jgi:predicted nuclease of predicted toxin-antitoxin system
MRFKTDENLHPEIAALLVRHGHDAVTLWDQGMRGKRDPEIAEVCRREQRVLVTLDLGFADIRRYPPDHFGGLIVLRPGSQSRSSVLGILEKLLPRLKGPPLAGRLWVVDETGIRERGGE